MFRLEIPSIFGSLRSSTPGSGKSRVRLRVILKTIKMVITAPQPVLVIKSVGKGNALAIKRRSSYQYIGPPGIIQKAGCLIR